MPRLTAEGMNYADKAVQTQDETALPNSSSTHSRNTLSLDTAGHSTASPLTEKPLALGVCSLPLYCSPISPQLGPSRSSPAHRRAYKHPGLAYGRPGQASSLDKKEKRVVSFPETSARDGGTNLTVPAVDGPSLRAVSLPKMETRPLSVSPTSGYNSSVEYLEVSSDASSLPSSRIGCMHLKLRSFPPSDMPATPSPPSSPESILIMGTRPRTAVCETVLSTASRFHASEDEAGWITWASSPPRPIPALHGPLSLPYARCPSGAEGTIIEDADLPRMIWGLDLDDSRAKAARNLSSTTVANTQPPYAVFGAENTSRGTPQGPLSPSTRVHVTSDQPSKGNGSMNIRHPPVQHVDARIQDPSLNYAKSDYLRNHTPIQMHGSLEQIRDDCDWRKSPISSIPARHMIPGLKASSPAFLPSTVASQPASMTYPRIFIEPRAGCRIAAGPRPSAIEIAQRYNVEQQQSTLYTPPTPSWSPMLSHYSPLSFSSQESGIYDIQDAASHYYCGSGSAPLPGRNFAEELSLIEAAQRELRSIIGLPGVPRLDFNSDAVWNTANTLPPVSIPQDPYRRSSPVIDVSLILQQQTSPCSDSTNDTMQDTMISSNLNQPRSSDSILQPRNPLGRKPHCTPLARLLQRRLSSVAEEEASCSTNLALPPSNSRHADTHPHLAHEENFYSITKGTSFSKNIESNWKRVDERPDSKESKTYGKTAVKNTNTQEERRSANSARNDKEKENAPHVGERTNQEKTAPKKKWRPRKKIRGTYRPAHKPESTMTGDSDD
ncbi:hypothetical protein LshimejAT787_0406640 [Lyophyllum shimeji]|uniref:Uncharacterized protein n=1 Tax=Lyophyllum shimeji TaxID=47721 RepID=A0A9P3ULG9_LYOSH|nr:hypothetical protein LshimejAT787_0406640 [Lyophyllum shimeji]